MSTSQNFLTASSSETPFRVKNEMSCLATPTAADPAPKKTVKNQKRRRVSTYDGPIERITQKDGSPIFWSPSALPLASALFWAALMKPPRMTLPVPWMSSLKVQYSFWYRSR